MRAGDPPPQAPRPAGMGSRLVGIGLTGNVVALGLVSLLNDTGSDMVRPLLPLFLTATLGASPLAVGVVEGIGDAVQAALKWFSGALSDRRGRRVALVLTGYGIAGAVRPLLAWVGAPWQVVAIRATDRVGKGLRSAPRDALIAASVKEGHEGFAFGFHRAMDHAGAILGPLLAFVAMAATGGDVRDVFLLAAIPGALAFLCILVFVREVDPQAAIPAAAPRPRPASGHDGGGLAAFLVLLGLFTAGTATDAFLVLRATDLGVAATSIPLLWASFHGAKVVSSLLGGVFTDKKGWTAGLVAGWALAAVAWTGLLFARSPATAWAWTLVYGLHAGLAEPAEKAVVRDIVRASRWGSAYGALGAVQGGGALVSGLVVGALWSAGRSDVAMLLSALAATGGALGLLAWARIRGFAPPAR